MIAAVVRPMTLPAAVDLLADAGAAAAPLAGGVAWMLRQARGEALPEVLVDLSGIDDLQGISRTDDGRLRIGAMTRLASIERSSVVAGLAPGLVAAMAAVGSVRIRHQATLGGNVAAAIARHDPPAMLLALDASVVAIGPAGEAEAPFLPTTPDAPASGLITAFLIAPARPGSAAAYRTLDMTSGARVGRIGAAVRLDLDDAGVIVSSRIVLVGPDDGPRRCRPGEAALDGRAPDATTVEAASAAVAHDVAQRPDADDDTVVAAGIVVGRASAAALAAAVGGG